MSWYRKVESIIFDDDKFPYLSEDAQRLFLFHLLSPRSTPFLLYVEGDGSMSDSLRARGKPMEPERITLAKQELHTAGMVWYADDHSNLVFLPKALLRKSNWPDGGNSLKTWITLFNDLPRTSFFFKCVARWAEIQPDIEKRITDAGHRNRLVLQFIDSVKGAAARHKVPFPKKTGDPLPPTEPPAPQSPPPRQTRTHAHTRTRREPTACPDPFDVTTELRQYARAKCGFDDETIRIETEKFLNYYKEETKKDWERTWRNWMLKALEIRNGRQPGARARAEDRERRSVEAIRG